jgi:hypothetical protein
VTALDFAILALAAFRLTRLAGWDTITHPARRRLLGVGDDGRPVPGRDPYWGAAAFVHCAWCVGFWIAVAVAICWNLWPDATLAASIPLALSAVVGVVAKNLDA